MERREYVFCEFCQTEVESNEAWVLESQSICEKCWAEKFDEKKHGTQRNKEYKLTKSEFDKLAKKYAPKTKLDREDRYTGVLESKDIQKT
jgi:hypothetical protein